MASTLGSRLFTLLATVLGSLALVACGTGYTYGTAPGGPPLAGDAGPPPPPADAGYDAGPPPPPRDAGPGCTIETVVPTPEDDLAAFVAQQLPAEFACASCHASSGSPTGEDGAWGPSNDPDADKRWFDGAVGLLSRADQAGLALTDTRLYAAFSGGIGGAFASQHPDDPTATAALVAWDDARKPYDVEECVDAGPSADAGPQDCTPTLPSEAQSETRYNQLNIGAAIAASNCQICHVGGAKTPTATGQAWGATTDDAAGWHDAFYGKALAEAANPITSSVLYTHLNGSDGTHGVKATERDATEQWLDYVLNGELPVGCP